MTQVFADSGARLRAVFDAGSVGLAFASLDGRFEEVNPALEALLGQSRAELLSTSIWDHAVSEDRDRERVADLIAGEATYTELERAFLRGDGAPATVVLTISVIRDAEGTPLELAITMRDVTAQRRFENELRHNLADSRAILETANDAFITMDSSGVIREWNRRAEQLFGWTREEALGRTVADTIVPESMRRHHVEGMARLAATGESRVLGRPLEMPAMRRDGTVFPAELTIWPSGTDGSPSFNAFIRDLSERQQAHQALSVSEMRFRALFEQSPMGIALQDTEGRIIASNSGLQRMLGYSADELLGRSYADLGHPDDIGPAQEIRAHLLSGQRNSVQAERRCVRKDGETIWLRVTASLVRDVEAGDAHREFFIAMSEDITTQKRADENRRQMTIKLLDLIGQAASEATTSEEALRVTLEEVCVHVGWHIGHVVWATDEGEGVPSDIWYFSDPERFEEFRRSTMEMTFASGQGLPGRVLATGRPHWTSDLGSDPLMFRGGAAQRVDLRAAFAFPVIVGQQVNAVMEFFGTEIVERDPTIMDAMAQVGIKLGRVIERKRLEAQLKHQAMHDPLTGLPNRVLFLDRLEHALTRLQRNSERLGLLFIDLDDFKVINDTYGHVTGDRVLVCVAERLRALLRPGDTIARHGGDEFIVLCEGIERDSQTVMIGERILETLELPMDIDGTGLNMTASIGIAVAANSRERPDALVANADVAMYRAKEQGGGRIERFDATLRAHTRQRRGTKVALRHALDRGELRVLYQPSISLRDGSVRAVEALIRWQHPERGLLMPDEIIPPAEETGLIVPIGTWVLEEACRQSVLWREGRSYCESPHMSVNLSWRQLNGADLPATLAEILATTGMDPRKLCLEITESILMNDTDSALVELQALRKLGVELGIDDFGTGYSSLSYLKRFPFGWLKIDRSFVQGLGNDRQDSAIVEAVICLAHALDLTVIAEGVETESQIEELRRLGCDWAQGYYFARPQPAAELEKLIESGASW